jgi:hypothetical protein
MPKKRFSAEQIVVVLRQIEVLMSQGKTPAVACREAAISQQSYYRWRKEYGGLELDQAKRMKELERENIRLKRLVADLSLEKQVFKDVASGSLEALSGAGRLLKAFGRSMVCPSVAPAGLSTSPAERNDTPLLSGPMKMC